MSILDYLRASAHNQLIVPQAVLTECLKGDAVRNTRRSLIGLAGFTSQVCILKADGVIMEMRPRATGLLARLIDHKLTTGLRRNLSYNLRQTGVAGLVVNRMIDHNKTAADGIQASYLRFSPRMKNGMLTAISTLSEDEKRALRVRKEILPSLFSKIGRNVSAATAANFKALGHDLGSISIFDAVYALQFRYAVAMESLMIEWCANSGLKSRSADRISNDLFDLSSVTYGTYFDGVLASDARLLRVAALARLLIQRLIEAPLGHTAKPMAVPANEDGS